MGSAVNALKRAATSSRMICIAAGVAGQWAVDRTGGTRQPFGLKPMGAGAAGCAVRASTIQRRDATALLYRAPVAMPNDLDTRSAAKRVLSLWPTLLTPRLHAARTQARPFRIAHDV